MFDLEAILNGETEFHTIDINRIIVENVRMKKLLNIEEI